MIQVSTPDKGYSADYLVEGWVESLRIGEKSQKTSGLKDE
jgi:hypothetical protein